MVTDRAAAPGETAQAPSSSAAFIAAAAAMGMVRLSSITYSPTVGLTPSATVAFAYPFVGPLAAVAGAAGATVADGVKATVGEYVVDDNLTIPIAAAAAMKAALLLGA